MILDKDLDVMKKSYSFLLVLLFLLVFGNCVFAQSYLCSEDGYAGNFNPVTDKPDFQRCDRLKGYTLSYNSCIASEKSKEKWYNLGLHAYNNGKCYLPETKTLTYGTAVCTAEYIAKDGLSSLSVKSEKGNASDIDACIKTLKKQLGETYPQLKSSRF